MPALELRPVAGWRVVADPDALDAVTSATPAPAEVLRLAPDEALVLGAEPAVPGDPYALVLRDGGWSGAELPARELEGLVRAHADWDLPAPPATLAQGLLAGVPVKLVVRTGRRALLLVPTCHVHELVERLA